MDSDNEDQTHDDNDNPEDNDNDMDTTHKETLMKMMLANPGLWRELLDADKEDQTQNYIDTSSKLEYLRTFCDWKNYLKQLSDINEDEEILDKNMLSTEPNTNPFDDDEKKSKSKVLESISDIHMDSISPYMLLDMLIMEKRMKKRDTDIYRKSNEEKLDVLIEDGVYDLKLKLYNNNIRYFEPNFEAIADAKSSRYLYQQMFSNAIDLSLHLYHKFLIKLKIKNKVNAKMFNKSYSVFHLLQKTGQQNEFNKLLSIFNLLNYSFLIPDSVINTVAQYSCVIYGKCIDSGSVHFIYASLMPSRYIYERLWYVKRENGDTRFGTDYFSETGEIAEVVHIFEPCHCDPRYAAEGKFGVMDVMLYYSSVDTYCIAGSSGIELIDFELPLYLQYQSNESV